MRGQTQKSGALKGGTPNWWAPKGGGSEGWGGPKFRAFFPSPATLLFLSSLSGCLLVDFWWCLKQWVPEMCTFGGAVV